MRDISLLPSLLLCGLLCLRATEAFRPSTNLPKPSLVGSPSFPSNLAHRRQSTSHLFQSSEDSDAPKKRRKRVKRKETAQVEEEENDDETTTTTPTLPDLKPRDDGPVQLQVKDVRDLVGTGAPKTTTATAATTFMPTPTKLSSTTIPKSIAGAGNGGLSDDSLKMLLEDAKEFQSLDSSSAVANGSQDENQFSIPDAFRNILSTVVTIDFFVVCAFLVWFLAGIFCSYILKDDTVQIAFNQLFQPVVQPALGILMIGAIAGSFGSKDEEEAL